MAYRVVSDRESRSVVIEHTNNPGEWRQVLVVVPPLSPGPLEALDTLIAGLIQARGDVEHHIALSHIVLADNEFGRDGNSKEYIVQLKRHHGPYVDRELRRTAIYPEEPIKPKTELESERKRSVGVWHRYFNWRRRRGDK